MGNVETPKPVRPAGKPVPHSGKPVPQSVETNTARPRWAKGLSEKTWTRIGELIDDGYPAAHIARQIELPKAQRRSLEIHVRKHGPRRRLTRYAEFKDALLGNVEAFGGSFARALTTIAEMAVNPHTDPTLQVRAVRAMNQFTYVLTRMMEGDEQAEETRERTERGRGEKVDPSEVVRRVLEHYGVNPDDQ